MSYKEIERLGKDECSVGFGKGGTRLEKQSHLTVDIR